MVIKNFDQKEGRVVSGIFFEFGTLNNYNMFISPKMYTLLTKSSNLLDEIHLWCDTYL